MTTAPSKATDPNRDIEPGLKLESLTKRNLDVETWRVLRAFYGDKPPSQYILLLVDYCRARNLDVLKRPVHLLPFKKQVNNKWVDSWQIVPGIGEQRITAARTGEYAGCDQVALGEVKTHKIGSVMIEAPEWASVTVYRVIGGARCAFAGPRLRFVEAVTTKGDGDPTPNWTKRPWSMLEKSAEAAALRRAFPEEVGDDDALPLIADGEPAGDPSAPVDRKSRLRSIVEEATTGGEAGDVEHGDLSQINSGEAKAPANDNAPAAEEPQAETPADDKPAGKTARRSRRAEPEAKGEAADLPAASNDAIAVGGGNAGSQDNEDLF